MHLLLYLALTLWQAPSKAPAKPSGDPFAGAPPAELNRYQAVLETTKGNITIEFMADQAPETVRYFLQLAAAEAYDLTLVHRVLPKTLIQTGAPFFRQIPISARQTRMMHRLTPENLTGKHTVGIVSMARDDDPKIPENSFFICTGNCKEFDGKYSPFGRVVAGMPVIRTIEAAPLYFERPKEKIILKHVALKRQ